MECKTCGKKMRAEWVRLINDKEDNGEIYLGIYFCSNTLCIKKGVVIVNTDYKERK